ncbi:hypothetical protein LE716_004536 [Salmonella enterica]|nr:hypothetical protein [Salmonella enterica]
MLIIVSDCQFTRLALTRLLAHLDPVNMSVARWLQTAPPAGSHVLLANPVIGLPDPAAHYSMMLHPGSPPFFSSRTTGAGSHNVSAHHPVHLPVTHRSHYTDMTL